MTHDLIVALELALPYVEKAANTQPTQPSGFQRRADAVKVLEVIKATLAKAVLAEGLA